MANYPTAMDGPSTLYSPVDAFSTKPLETTATGAIGAGDSTISVASTVGGFAATYGVLSIDDELICEVSVNLRKQGRFGWNGRYGCRSCRTRENRSNSSAPITGFSAMARHRFLRRRQCPDQARVEQGTWYVPDGRGSLGSP